MAVSSKQWADGPFELLPTSMMGYKSGERLKSSHTVAEDMIMVDNVLLRGINSVYLQRVNVETRSPESVTDFVNYAQQWGLVVREHHSNEELFFFLEIARFAGEDSFMVANVGQHAAFHDGLEAYMAYVGAVKSGAEEYRGQRQRDLIESFMPAPREHLWDEIKTLLALEEYEDRGDRAVWLGIVQAQILMQTATYDAKDGRFAGWPPIPWSVPLLARWFFAPRHKAWWRFAPCDVSGQPRDKPSADRVDRPQQGVWAPPGL